MNKKNARSSSKKIGLYGGSFDPIHFGHISLALELMEKASLDEVWFIPSNKNPDKAHNDSCEAEHRLQMVKLAIKDIPNFKVLDIEIARGGLSYTAETITNLHQSHPNYTFFLLIGCDLVNFFCNWHKIDEVTEQITLLVGKRHDNNCDDCQKTNTIPSPFLLKTIQTKIIEVSSSEIRNRLKANKYCKHLVPNKVLDYIYKNELY